MEENKKARLGRRDHWLVKDIVVKVTSNRAGQAFYKKKGVVKVLFKKNVKRIFVIISKFVSKM